MEMTILYGIVCLFGVLAHFLKKKVTGESIADVVDYFKTHFKSTLLVIGAAFVGFMTLQQTGTVGYLPAFMVGYTADSLFNKNKVDDIIIKKARQ